MATIEERVRRAVHEGMVARSAYYRTIHLPDEQRLGPPATEAQLSDLEHFIKKSLPPSYKVFLSLHNGWRMINGAMDLLSVEEMLGGRRADAIAKWREAVRVGSDEVASNALVIGYSDIVPSRILLDPSQVDEIGEWRVLRYHHNVEDENTSFIEFLERSAAGFKELAAFPLDDGSAE